jgi:LPXTG-site transpeptidase (sortase) family protein
MDLWSCISRPSGITRTIWDGTDAQTLSKGVGLYEYAQLPGEGNRNVSLAGHRNGLDKNGNVTDHAPFYYVDTLGEGDYFYLTGGGRIYRYLYDDTWVVRSPTTGAPSPPRAIAA